MARTKGLLLQPCNAPLCFKIKKMVVFAWKMV